MTDTDMQALSKKYKRLVIGCSGRALFPDRPDPTEEVDRLYEALSEEERQAEETEECRWLR